MGLLKNIYRIIALTAITMGCFNIFQAQVLMMKLSQLLMVI